MIDVSFCPFLQNCDNVGSYRTMLVFPWREGLSLHQTPNLKMSGTRLLQLTLLLMLHCMCLLVLGCLGRDALSPHAHPWPRSIRAALPYLLKSKAARIVNISSTEAIVAAAGLTAYNAAKAGVMGLTRSFAVELGRLQNITVNCIMPGPIRSKCSLRF